MRIVKGKISTTIESNKMSEDALNKKIQKIMRMLKKEIIANFSDKKNLK